MANEVQEEDGTWTLPNPPLLEDRVNANGSSLREQLEDVEMELLALTWRTAAEMNVVNPVAGEGWPSAQKDLERTLGCHGCKFRNSRDIVTTPSRPRNDWLASAEGVLCCVPVPT